MWLPSKLTSFVQSGLSSPLFPIASRYMWTVPIVGVLGFIASGLEGLGISLLIPALSFLLSDPGIDKAQGPLGFLFRFASMLDEDVRLLAIAATMFALVVAKGVIQAANGIFAAWIDGKASHDIRCDLSRRLLSVGYPFFLREDPARLVTIMSTEAWRASDAIQIIFSTVSMPAPSRCSVSCFSW